MFNIFALFAVLFLLLSLALSAGLVYVSYAKHHPNVGSIVRTTFSGNPAVLTSALWGVNKQYIHSVTDQDNVNALHCDLFGAYGTHSTWVSDGGLNFKTIPWIDSVTLMYYNNLTCSQDSDCSLTKLQCGPAYQGWVPKGLTNNAAKQCPANSNCSLCNGLDCSNVTDSLAIGHCINSSSGYPLFCKDTGFSKHCAAYVPTGSITFNRLNSCSQDHSYASFCSNVGPSSLSYFICSISEPTENFDCAFGQTCVPNTTSLSGWCPPATSCPYYTASSVCSGTVNPNVSINTKWIAEGVVTNITGSYANVDWQRIRNTYPGIGPSPYIFDTFTKGVKTATQDFSWIYSDCRFIDMGEPGRHASVSYGLLGSSITDPSWNLILDNSRTHITERVIYVGQSVGQNQAPIQSQTYYRSAWDLHSVNVPLNSLERIWFYSIQNLDTSSDALYEVGRNFLYSWTSP